MRSHYAACYMAVGPFPQNIIAVIWDFDKTLIPGYMQDPLFHRYDVDGRRFWDEVNALPAFYADRGHPAISADTIYLSHILTYVREGIFEGLTNEVLRDLGKSLAFYAGMPEFLGQLKQAIESDPRFEKYEIKLEHYVVSTGLRQTIMGSAVAQHLDDLWACEFLESTAPPGFLDDQPREPVELPPGIQSVGYAIDNTSKTRAIFEINKGVNKHSEITVNTAIAPEDRRVPIANMIYVADGPSDVPVFSIVNQYGGRTFAVYNPSGERDFRQAADLLDQKRVQAVGPADYTPGSQTARWLNYWAEQIAGKIASRKARALGESLGKPPEHILDEGDPSPQNSQGEAGSRGGEDT